MEGKDGAPMFHRKEGLILIVRLQTGEDVVACLQRVAQEYRLQTAVILSGIGMWQETELGFFQGPAAGYEIHPYPEPCELLALTGNLSRQESGIHLHLHATLAMPNGSAVGGHLLKATVKLTNEISLLETEIPVFRRKEENGLMGMFLE
jgi:predicted DNA-binding protein with PD1-like motif